MKIRKHCLAVLLAMLMLLSCIPFAANAEGEPEPEPEEPTEWIEVYTIEDLYCIRYNLTANYKLMNDLDLTEATAPDGDWSFVNQGWDPIGSDGRYYNKEFSGIFDGCGHMIYGLTMNVTKIPTGSGSTVYFGLFAAVSGTVRNLTVAGSITANDSYYNYAGGITAFLNETGLIENCTNLVKLSISGGSSQYVGGIAGRGYGMVRSSTNAASVYAYSSSGYSFVTGIVGLGSLGSIQVAGTPTEENYKCKVLNCLNSGTITAEGRSTTETIKVSDSGVSYTFYSHVIMAVASGIANFAKEVRNCYNVGTVKAEQRGSSDSDCYAYNNGIAHRSYVYNCYNIGSLPESGTCRSGNYAIGGFTATNCYYLNGTGKNVQGAIAVSAAQLKRQAIFNGWDFENVWTMECREDYDYPELRDTPLILPSDLLLPLGGTLKISGASEVGETLTADLSAVTPAGATVSYEWRIGDTVVGTAKSYTLKEEDVNNELTLTVTGTGDYKGSLTASCIVGEIHEHEEEIMPYVAPTCAAVGYTEGVRCAICGEIIVAQNEIAKLSHTPKTVAGYPATCIRTGLSDGSVCDVCGAVLVKQKRLPTIDHDFVFVEGTLPTCTEPGLTDGSQCSMCGAWELAQEEIPAKRHAYVAQETVAPKCNEQGYTLYVCQNGCGSSYQDNFTGPTGAHNWKETVLQAGSCTEDAVKEYVCMVCGDSYTETTDAPGHIDDNQDGICDVCKQRISGQEECQHSWGLKDGDPECLRTPADCYHAATYYFRCAKCGLRASEISGAEGGFYYFGEWTCQEKCSRKTHKEASRWKNDHVFRSGA